MQKGLEEAHGVNQPRQSCQTNLNPTKLLSNLKPLLEKLPFLHAFWNISQRGGADKFSQLSKHRSCAHPRGID
jgi:hypothetical protein